MLTQPLLAAPGAVVHGCRLPAPVAICSIIGQMREQQQQQWRPADGSASAGMEAATGGAALTGVDITAARFGVTTPAAAAGGPCGLQALLDVAVCQHHLHLRRQQWSQQQADLCTLQQQPGQAAADLGRLGACAESTLVGLQHSSGARPAHTGEDSGACGAGTEGDMEQEQDS